MSDDGSTATMSEWRPRANPWLIALPVMLATFMVILDTSIVVVALPYIAGNLGATQDESTWVLTSYLVANAVILPASAWFSSFFGRKRFLVGCTIVVHAGFADLRCRDHHADAGGRPGLARLGRRRHATACPRPSCWKVFRPPNAARPRPCSAWASWSLPSSVPPWEAG